MKSLGIIETTGFIAAIQAVDAACKAAGVTCTGYRKVGSGLVSVCFEGEISAVKTAVERGVAASHQPVSSLIIARPDSKVVQAIGQLKGSPAPTPTRCATPPNPATPKAAGPARTTTASPTADAADAADQFTVAGIDQPAENSGSTAPQFPSAEPAMLNKSANNTNTKKGKKA